MVIKFFVLPTLSLLFNIPCFPFLGLNVIIVASIVFYPLPYLLWCLTSLCLLPLPSGLHWPIYWPSTLPPSAASLSWFSYSHPYVFHDQIISTLFSLTYDPDFFLSNPDIALYILLFWNLCTWFQIKFPIPLLLIITLN